MAPQTRSMTIRRAEVVSLHGRVLPEEMIEEILARLPVKSVLKFRCVSKSWRSLLGSDRFIKIYLQNKTFAHWKFMFKDFGSNCYTAASFRSVDLVPIYIDDPINDHHLMTGRAVGGCNGVLCFLKEGCFFLWNPATRISVELPKIGYNVTIQKYGFGRDVESGAYKAIAIVSRPNKRPVVVGKVYSSKTNSWKTLDYDTEYFDLQSDMQSDMEYFDLETEEFGRIDHPNCTFQNFVLLLGNTKVMMLTFSSNYQSVCRYIESLVSPQVIVNGRPKRQRRSPDRYA